MKLQYYFDYFGLNREEFLKIQKKPANYVLGTPHPELLNKLQEAYNKKLSTIKTVEEETECEYNYSTLFYNVVMFYGQSVRSNSLIFLSDFNVTLTINSTYEDIHHRRLDAKSIKNNIREFEKTKSTLENIKKNGHFFSICSFSHVHFDGPKQFQVIAPLMPVPMYLTATHKQGFPLIKQYLNTLGIDATIQAYYPNFQSTEFTGKLDQFNHICEVTSCKKEQLFFLDNDSQNINIALANGIKSLLVTGENYEFILDILNNAAEHPSSLQDFWKKFPSICLNDEEQLSQISKVNDFDTYSTTIIPHLYYMSIDVKQACLSKLLTEVKSDVFQIFDHFLESLIKMHMPCNPLIKSVLYALTNTPNLLEHHIKIVEKIIDLHTRLNISEYGANLISLIKRINKIDLYQLAWKHARNESDKCNILIIVLSCKNFDFIDKNLSYNSDSPLIKNFTMNYLTELLNVQNDDLFVKYINKFTDPIYRDILQIFVIEFIQHQVLKDFNKILFLIHMLVKDDIANNIKIYFQHVLLARDANMQQIITQYLLNANVIDKEVKKNLLKEFYDILKEKLGVFNKFTNYVQQILQKEFTLEFRINVQEQLLTAIRYNHLKDVEQLLIKNPLVDINVLKEAFQYLHSMQHISTIVNIYKRTHKEIALRDLSESFHFITEEKLLLLITHFNFNDIDCQDKNGNRLLDIAIEQKSEALATLLFQLGIEIDYISKQGYSPLQVTDQLTLNDNDDDDDENEDSEKTQLIKIFNQLDSITEDRKKLLSKEMTLERAVSANLTQAVVKLSDNKKLDLTEMKAISLLTNSIQKGNLIVFRSLLQSGPSSHINETNGLFLLQKIVDEIVKLKSLSLYECITKELISHLPSNFDSKNLHLYNLIASLANSREKNTTDFKYKEIKKIILETLNTKELLKNSSLRDFLTEDNVINLESFLTSNLKKENFASQPSFLNPRKRNHASIDTDEVVLYEQTVTKPIF